MPVTQKQRFVPLLTRPLRANGQLSTCFMLAGSLTLGIPALLTLHSSASAQDALGAGNLLDANLNQSTGPYNTPRQAIDYRARNLLITGNVAGGRHFRGSVGYTAVGDFSDDQTLGSNDTYDFRRNSVFSSVPFVRIADTYSQLRYGQDIGIVEYQRDMTGSRMSNIYERQPLAFQQELVDSSIKVNRVSLESDSRSVLDRSVEPTVRGATPREDGSLLYLKTSPLRGITAESSQSAGQLFGLNSAELIRLREDIIANPEFRNELGYRFEPDFTSLASPAPSADEATSSINQGIDSTLPTQVPSSPETQAASYQSLLQRISDRYTASRVDREIEIDQSIVNDLSEDYRRLRDSLRAGTESPATEDEPSATTEPSQDAANTQGMAPPPTDSRTSADRSSSRRRDDAELRSPLRGTLRPSDAVQQPPPVSRPPADLQPILDALQHGQRVQQLAAEGDTTLLNQLIQEGEERLARGEYFWAERRFERALRIKPGQPMAQAGLGHAQLGAGLHRSASLTLRDLLTSSPEMIDVRYAAGALPNAIVLSSASASLQRRIAREDDLTNAGFMLAYIGHQLQDRDMINAGLDAMHKGNPQDSFTSVLREIWLAPPRAAQPSK